MDKIIKSELDKLNITVEQAKETIFIPKVNRIKLNEDSFYFIRVLPQALNPSEDSLIVSNWNGGVKPTSEYYQVMLLNKVGDMIKVNGMSCDSNKVITNRIFNGWFKLSDIEILEKL